ncbi:MAG: hypothetical protein BWY75_03364 [bacterium ADurb.Bin425]|nr:MAG: hypothetical protein BWY75_03364 [bacterium ADurb.Bin425]
MIGIHQTGRGDDAVSIVVGVVGEGQVIVFTHFDKPGHGIGRRAVHADLAVPVNMHK